MINTNLLLNQYDVVHCLQLDFQKFTCAFDNNLYSFAFPPDSVLVQPVIRYAH